jgi:two-component system response regulator LytT
MVDYLLKSLELPRFQKALDKTKKNKLESSSSNKKGEENENYFYVNIDRRLMKIDLPSIYLIEAKVDYIHIKTEDKNYVVHSTLKKIVDKLPGSSFLKIYRSYIINIKKNIYIQDNSVLIKKDVIPVSNSKRPELMKRLDLL